MGVRGLKSFVLKLGLGKIGKWPIESGCKVVIDGSALIHFVFNSEYKINRLTDFDEKFKLILLQLKKYFVITGIFFDGASVHQEKMRTIVERQRNAIQSKNSQVNIIMPRICYEIAKNVLKELDISPTFCIDEADVQVYLAAVQSNAFVISNDTDFLIFPVIGLIFIDSLLETSNLMIGRLISCFDLSKHLNVPVDRLNLLAVLSGNDYSPDIIDNSSYGSHERIRKVAKKLSSYPCNITPKQLLKSYFGKINTAKVSLILERSNIMYRVCELDKISLQVLQKFRDGSYPNCMIDVVKSRCMFCHVQQYPSDRLNPWVLFVSLRQFLYRWLSNELDFEIEVVREYLEIEKDFRSVQVQSLSMDAFLSLTTNRTKDEIFFSLLNVNSGDPFKNPKTIAFAYLWNVASDELRECIKMYFTASDNYLSYSEKCNDKSYVESCLQLSLLHILILRDFLFS